MVCLPITADQPLVAYRVADELGLGIRLNTKLFSPLELKNAIEKVLSDKTFGKRAEMYQKLSRNYNGSKNFVEIVISSLKND